jgi:PRC-barrel domain
MDLHRLEHHRHPRPPHHELRQKTVFDSGVRSTGQVSNLYVDDDMELRFLDVCTSGFLGFGTKHYLVPAEAIAEEAPGSVTLKVDQQTVEGAPRLSNPHDAPDEGLQRAAHEHFGLGAVL